MISLSTSRLLLQDFVEGAERIIATSSANDVPTNPQYSKVVLKRVVKEHDAKDMRKTCVPPSRPL